MGYKYASFLGLVSFDCHPRSPFFSHRRRALLLLISVFSFRHHSLALLRRSLPFRQQHSLSLLKRLLARYLCSEVPAGLLCSPPPGARTLRIALSLSLLSESRHCSRPVGHVRDGKRCQRMSTAASSIEDASMSPPSGARCRPPRYHHGCDATFDPPPWPRSPCRKSSSRWKLITPFY
jgi:hypothetical protein